jgi:hypothetical protein
MLKGMHLAWFEQYRRATRDMAYSLQGRHGGLWGISVDDDNKALRFRIAECRAARAEQALNGDWLPDAIKMFRKTALKARAELKRRANTGERMGIHD